MRWKDNFLYKKSNSQDDVPNFERDDKQRDEIFRKIECIGFHHAGEINGGSRREKIEKNTNREGREQGRKISYSL